MAASVAAAAAAPATAADGTQVPFSISLEALPIKQEVLKFKLECATVTLAKISTATATATDKQVILLKRPKFTLHPARQAHLCAAQGARQVK